MWFHVDPSSGAPIYRQLVEQVRQAVASGVLRVGDKLPSVRELALELTVNPNTVAKSYQALEREGTIETLRGKGSFVAQRDHPLAERERLRLFDEAAQRLAVEAYRLQIPQEQALQMVWERLAEAETRRGGADRLLLQR